MKKILLIDDDLVSAKMTSSLLERQGFFCSILNQSDKAMELLKREKVDLIILDIMMPIVSGAELLKEIRAIWNSFELPVIMLTGKSADDDIVDAMKNGANDYLIKPININIGTARITTQLKLQELYNMSIESQKIKSINAVVTTLNHEINNPLAIALGNLSFGIKAFDQAKLDKTIRALTRINELVKKIDKVTSSDDLIEENYAEKITMVKFK